jgi:hypothetical protein
MLQEEIDGILQILNKTDWASGSYGDTLICPCGEELELDAEKCSCGRKNPLVEQGLI